MKKINFFVASGLLFFSFSGVASDNWEKILEKGKLPQFLLEKFNERHIPWSNSTENIEQNEEKRENNKKAPVKKIKEKITNLSGLPLENVLSESEGRKFFHNQKFNTFHVLNDFLSKLVGYLDLIKSDEDLEWTFKNVPFFIYDEILPKDKICQFKNDIPIIMDTNYIYNIQRYNSFVKTVHLFKFVLYLKKNIFPTGTIESLDVDNAIAMRLLLVDFMDNMMKNFKGTPFYREIITLISSLYGSLEEHKKVTKIYSMKERDSKETREKMENAEKIVHEKTQEYSKNLSEYVSKCLWVDKFFNALVGIGIGKVEANKEIFSYLAKYDQYYKNAQDHKFKFSSYANMKKINFSMPFPFEFKELYSNISGLFENNDSENLTFDNIPNNPENPLPKIEQVQDNVQETISENEKNNENVNIEEKHENSREEEVIDEKTYWEEINAYHSQRKKELYEKKKRVFT